MAGILVLILMAPPVKMEDDNQKSFVHDTAAFVVMFLVLWAGAWLLHAALNGGFQNVPLAGDLYTDTLFWMAMKALIWVLFPLLYFKNRFSHLALWIGLNRAELGSGLQHGLVLSGVWVALSLLTALMAHQSFGPPNKPWPIVLYTAVYTPIVEEWVFRGHVQGHLMAAGKRFWLVNIMTTVCFVLPHLVGWSFQGVLRQQVLSMGVVGVILISLYLGYVRQTSRSLLGSVIVHSANNFLSLFLR